MRSIVRLTLELRRSVNEAILSSDLEMVVATCGEPYAEGKMDDAYSTGVSPKDQWVMCTTELGLRRVEQAGDERPPLLKPKVALASLADELQLERIRVEAGQPALR